MKKLRGYIFSRSFLGERVPQRVQNIVLRDYCRTQGYELLLATAEYAIPRSYLILRSVLDELPAIDGVVMYSMFQLPEDQNERHAIIFDDVLKQGKEIHFAAEAMKIVTSEDARMIEECWLVRQALPEKSAI